METKKKLVILATAALVTTVAAATPLAGQAGRADLFEDGVDRAEALVVRLLTPDGGGAGILFHADSRYVYGITARHVVLSRDGRKVEALHAELRQWPNEKFPVESYRFHHEEDLAVFRIDVSALGLSVQDLLRSIPLDQLGSSSALDPGDLLHSMGHSAMEGWISPKADVKFGRADGKSSFLFELACPPGHSGGGVFDKDWRLVGMIVDEAPPYCRALRIEPVLKIVQAWNLDISLRSPPRRQGDEASPRQITVAVVDFDNRSPTDLPNLGYVAQDITTSFLHTLPGVVLVSRDRMKSLLREIDLPGTLQKGEGISRVGRLLSADALVTGSILRYDVERRSFAGYGTSALQDVFRMSISLQILHVDSGRVQFSKTFDVDDIRQYPVASSAPPHAIDLTSELLKRLLSQAEADIKAALSQVAAMGGNATKFLRVRVTTSPAGADVILNGSYLGHTPYDLQVTQDSHLLHLELAGYEPWERRVKIQPGMTIEVTLVPRR